MDSTCSGLVRLILTLSIIQIIDNAFCAALTESVNDLCPDAARTARDKGDFAGEIEKICHDLVDWNSQRGLQRSNLLEDRLSLRYSTVLHKSE